MDSGPVNRGVLVVDDDLEMRKLLSELLASERLTVHTAADGADALRQVLERQPALIILDLCMPRLNGVSLCRAIRADKQARDTPIFVVTSRDTQAQLEECITAGADDFIGKPFDATDLLLRVRAMLMSRHIADLVERTQHYILTLRKLRGGSPPNSR